MTTAFVALAERVLKHVQDFPQEQAVVCDGQSLSYGALIDAALQYAGHLQTLGLIPGGDRRVAVIAANSLDYAVVILACQISGVAVVPLPGLIMPDALARMLDDSNTSVIFHDVESADRARTAVALATTAKSLTLIEMSSAVFASKTDYAPVTIAPEWTSDFIYSSGTTGIPKGIVQSYGSRTAQNESLIALGVTPRMKLLLTVGLYSNFGMGALLLTLWWGGTFFMMRKFSAAVTVGILSSEEIDMAWFAPATLVRTMEASEQHPSSMGKPFAKLCAGAPLSTVQKKQVLALWPGPFFDLYGQTETGTLTLLPIHVAPEEKFGSVGRPLPSVAVRIIDDAGRVLPPDAEGEIAGHSSTLMAGYHGRDAASAMAFWKDDEGRMYVRTGDVGRFDADGYLWLCDRKKDMLKSGGYNIYPADIERVLQDHPAVLETAVVGFSSSRWGETPVAFITLREGTMATEDELKEWVNHRVGAIQRVAVVRILASLPSGSMGKILKRELREKYQASVGALP